MNSMDLMPKKQASEQEWVPESRFGQWFQTTDIWYDYVLSEALFDFKQLLDNSIAETRQLLDIGCHQGVAFQLLEQHFQPKTIIGIDIDSNASKKVELGQINFKNFQKQNLKKSA